MPYKRPKPVFLKLSFHGGTPKITVHIPEEPLPIKKNYKETVVAQGVYSNIFSCRTKILKIFRVYLYFVAVFQNSLRIYSTVSHGITEGPMWNAV